MHKKRLALFVALVIFCVVLMTVQVKLGPLNPLQFLSYPLNAANEIIHEGMLLAKEPVRLIMAAGRENERLAKENAALKEELRAYAEMKAEHERYRDLLALRDRQPRFLGAAAVISRGADLSIKTFIVDRGSSDGISKDMVAITPDGLVGKIIRVWPEHAELLLINDNSFSVSVRIEGSRVEGILTGNSRTGRLHYVSNEVDVHTGDVVVTSNLDRFFPEGILVGTVRSARKTTPELFQDIVVTPLVDTSRVEEVAILHK